jgi:hypothetical protein
MKSRRLSATRCSCTSGCVSFIFVTLGSLAVSLCSPGASSHLYVTTEAHTLLKATLVG